MDEDLFKNLFHSTLKQDVLKPLLTLVKWELRTIVKLYKDVE